MRGNAELDGAIVSEWLQTLEDFDEMMMSGRKR
jgi:hypothetical protein